MELIGEIFKNFQSVPLLFGAKEYIDVHSVEALPSALCPLPSALGKIRRFWT